VLRKDGSTCEAEEMHNKELEINFELAEIYYNKGNSLYKGGEIDEALKCYEKALEYNSDYEDAIKKKEEIRNL